MTDRESDKQNLTTNNTVSYNCEMFIVVVEVVLHKCSIWMHCDSPGEKESTQW